jgi:hypothetical protein
LPLPGYQFTQQYQETPFFLKGLVQSNVVPIKLGVDPKSPTSAYQHMGAGSLLGAFQESNPRRNYIEQWNINIQHQITSTVTASVGYIGSHGVHMMFRGDDGDMVIPTQTSAGYLWPANPTGADLRINELRYPQIFLTPFRVCGPVDQCADEVRPRRPIRRFLHLEQGDR